MATPSPSQREVPRPAHHSKTNTFAKLLGSRACSCGRSETVDPSVECVPVNNIHEVLDTIRNFVVVGAGKTGIDAVLHLLHRGVDPSRIDRVFYDPKKMIIKWGAFFGNEATHRESLLSQERRGMLLRLDEDVWPTKYDCATVSQEELIKL